MEETIQTNQDKINNLELLAKDYLIKYGLVDWKFEYNQATNIFGLCRHDRKTIEMSIRLALANTEEECKSTILHEIAHALVGAGHGHDLVWAQKAIELGIKPNRCGGSGKIETRYIAKCIKCGKVVKIFNRIPKYRRSCSTCMPGKFSEDCLMVFSRNPDFETYFI